MATGSVPGWYNDPTGRYLNRYWDGTQWTESVSSGGSNTIDAISAADRLAPPAPGTAAPSPVAATPTSINVSTEGGRSGGGSGVGIVLGIVALILAAAIVIGIVANDDDDSSPTTSTEAPTTTEAPADDGE